MLLFTKIRISIWIIRGTLRNKARRRGGGSRGKGKGKGKGRAQPARGGSKAKGGRKSKGKGQGRGRGKVGDNIDNKEIILLWLPRFCEFKYFNICFLLILYW